MKDDYCSVVIQRSLADIFLTFGIVFEFINSHGKNMLEYFLIPLWKWISKSMEYWLLRIPKLDN